MVENIYPIEIEEVLYQMPEILEAAVVGLPHEVYGEVPKAFVVLKEGSLLMKIRYYPIVKHDLPNTKYLMKLNF